MSKTLLVLGGSVYQLETILTARRLGYRVVVTDNVPSNPGHRIADRSRSVDTTDRDAVLALARDEGIAGIIAPCTDVAVPTAARVAAALGLPGPPEASAEILCDKIRFRGFLTAHGFPCPGWSEFSAEAEPAARPWGTGRRVMKPDRSSGSKGIFIVGSREEFLGRVRECLAFSPGGRGVLEEFVDGHQGTCEGILVGGRVVRSWVLDRITAPEPFVVTRGQRIPSRLQPADRSRVLGAIERIFALLEVADGPFDCDFILAPDGVRILEMSPRLGGNSISSLLRKSTGYDLVEYAVRQACGDAPPVSGGLEIRPTAVVLLGTEDAGTLAYATDELAALRLEPWVDSIDFDVAPGTPVQPFINGRCRVGQAFVHGRDRAELDAHVAEVSRRLRVRAEP